jgi:drug/metabolite transporter (DMT)-like permease
VISSAQPRAYLLLGSASIIWASNAVAGRFAADHIGPATLTLFRWLLASIVILPIALPHLRRDRDELKKHWRYIAGMGICGFAGFNLALYTALNHTTAIFATIAQAAIPMMVMMACLIVLRERLTVGQIGGFLLTVVGIAMTVSEGQVWRLLDQPIGLGELWMLLATVLYAIYSYFLRYRPALHALSFISGMVFAATLFALPFGAIEIARIGLPEMTPEVIFLVVYTAVMASLVSQSAYAAGVAIIGPSRASLFINAVPVFGAILAMLILGEVYRWYHAAGLVLVMGGIAMAEHSRQKS